jgi:LmbE family N-acetylglucosaminyl deacetylase
MSRQGRREAASTQPSRARKNVVSGLVLFALIVVCGAGGAGVAAALVKSPLVTPASTSTELPTSPPDAAATDQPTPVETQEPPQPEPEQTVAPAPPAPPAPLSPADTPCATPVTMSIWAHYDDDLIFLNPQLQGAFDAGDCVRTVFLTGSDAGRGRGYASGRELGILRAYNIMRGQQGLWSEKPVTLLSGAELSQWSPDGDPDITVSFLRLADGNLSGGGFPATGNVALPQLLAGSIPSMTPIQGDGPALSSEAVVSTLAELITAYHASRLFTHVPGNAVGYTAGDHPDHQATGAFARAAWQRAGFPVDHVGYAVGYPSMELPVNVSGDVLTRKLGPYRVYAAQDSVVACATDAACLAKPKFGAWLQRNYVLSDGELFPDG